MVSAVPNPYRRAMVSTPSRPFSSSIRAASMRARSTYRPGLIPSSRAKTRPTCLGLIDSRSAIAGINRSAAMSPTSRRSASSAGAASDQVLNCDCPPGRCRKTTSHLASQVRAVILLDQRQRQIDTCGHPRRGDELAIPHKDRVCLHPHGGIRRGQRSAVRPVRSGPPSIQQSRLGQHERARAHRGDPASPRRQPLNLGDRLGVEHRVGIAQAPRHDHGVHIASRPHEVDVDPEPDARGGVTSRPPAEATRTR